MIFPNPFQDSSMEHVKDGAKAATAGLSYAFVQAPKKAAEAVGFWIGQAVGLFGLNEALSLERREEECIIAGEKLRGMGIVPRRQHASRIHYKGARLTDEFINLVIKENPLLHCSTNQWVEHKLKQMQTASECGSHEACLDEKIFFDGTDFSFETSHDRGVHLARVVFFHGRVIQHELVDLTSDDVAKGVEGIGSGYEPYAAKIRELGINGVFLQQIDEKKLTEALEKDVGVVNETHRQMILCELNKIRLDQKKKPLNTCDLGIFVLEHRMQGEVDGWFFAATKPNMEEAKVCMNKIMGFHCWKQLSQETGAQQDHPGSWQAMPESNTLQFQNECWSAKPGSLP